MLKRLACVAVAFAMALSVAAVVDTDPAQAAASYTIKPQVVCVDGGGRFDVRIAAGEKTWGYDTIQGACAHDGYAYMSLYNRQKEKIKIAKVDLSTMKVVKKSGVLSCRCHADSMAYNERNNTLVICRGKGSRKSIAVVDATSLRLKYTRTINISRKMAGGRYYGLSSIAYNAENNFYIVKLKGSSNKIVRLNSSFKPVKRIRIEGNRSYLLAQSLYTTGSFMYDVQSFKGRHKYNLITVRNVFTGKLLGRMVIASGKSGQLYELENVFCDGDQWYISFYRAKVLKRGDRDRKNYLCRINVPARLKPPVPVVEPEASPEAAPEEQDSSVDGAAGSSLDGTAGSDSKVNGTVDADSSVDGAAGSDSKVNGTADADSPANTDSMNGAAGGTSD
ncbi:MAG: hypothetical protein ACI4KL_00125 [Lentihominibacter sp.]